MGYVSDTGFYLQVKTELHRGLADKKVITFLNKVYWAGEDKVWRDFFFRLKR